MSCDLRHTRVRNVRLPAPRVRAGDGDDTTLLAAVPKIGSICAGQAVDGDSGDSGDSSGATVSPRIHAR